LIYKISERYDIIFFIKLKIGEIVGMRIIKNRMLNKVKTSLSWTFFFAIYPYLVLSLVHSVGTSVTAIIFSYISLIPTMLLFNLMVQAREKSIEVNEFLADKASEICSYNEYDVVVKVLKALRIVILVLMALIGLGLLIKICNMSAIISSSLNSFSILLLQAYYVTILMVKIKYEA
jgi:hypothetical protein